MEIPRFTCLIPMAILLASPLIHAQESPSGEISDSEIVTSLVEIEEIQGIYRLLVDGEPYYIKGVGGDRYFEEIAALGGNTVRTWGTDQTETSIDAVADAGLKLAAGIWIQHERHGFDYNDEDAVQRQIDEHKVAVDRFKDHPGLLMWIVGNEVELNHTNPKVWDVIEAVAAYIKQVDPNHPVATVTAHAVTDVIHEIVTRCPSIDILGMNSYAGISVVADDLRKSEWTGPFMITEWGPSGTWEVGKTSWGAELEQTSTEKAEVYAFRYKDILEEHDACLGSFAFYWGQKQETTPTWFGIFTEDGRHTEIYDTLAYLWSSRFPSFRSPRIANLKMNDAIASSSVIVEPGSRVTANFQIIRGDLESIEVEWVLLQESKEKGVGGDLEPEEVMVNFEEMEVGKVQFLAPNTLGTYRLFVYVKGLGHSIATANIPFKIEKND